MDFWACCFPSASRENISTSAGRFSQPSASGGPARCPSTCISIPPGPMRTRRSRWRSSCGTGIALAAIERIPQWILLGLLSGFIVDVYYPNGALLMIPLLEGIAAYWADFKSRANAGAAMVRLFVRHLDLCERVRSGSAANTDLQENHFWKLPADRLHAGGRLVLGLAGILECAVLIGPRHAQLDADSDPGPDWLAAFSACRSIIRHVRDRRPSCCSTSWSRSIPTGTACRPSAVRFFISLTPLFILGLAAFFDWLAQVWQERRAAVWASTVTALLIVWNLGLVFQWGTHLIPARGPISWRDAAYNQVAVVPVEATRTIESLLDPAEAIDAAHRAAGR